MNILLENLLQFVMFIISSLLSIVLILIIVAVFYIILYYCVLTRYKIIKDFIDEVILGIPARKRPIRNSKHYANKSKKKPDI
jgi:type II secretory pathway component PulF